MQLKVLPAAKGDCLILHHRDANQDKIVLIDGGPGGVYTRTLKPRLLDLRKARVDAGLMAHDAPLFIDLVIVSHIDDDHINGIKALLGEMAAREDDGDPPLFSIGRLWHNGFDSLLGAQSGTVDSPPTAAVTASLGGTGDAGDEDGESGGIMKVVASIGQGHDVVALAKRLGIPINPEFAGKAIIAEGGAPRKIEGLDVTVLGPLKAELDALRADFQKWLAKKASGDATPASLLAAFTDNSVANLSSIVLLVDDGDRRFLLTGDARGDKIIAAVAALGLAGANEPFALDLLKVQHHGSDRNNAEDFFAKFPAAHYVFSGNGEHGNPERATFGFLADALKGQKVVVELTYSPEEIDAARTIEWNRKHKNGPAFDPASQGIVGYLATKPNLEPRFPH